MRPAEKTVGGHLGRLAPPAGALTRSRWQEETDEPAKVTKGTCAQTDDDESTGFDLLAKQLTDAANEKKAALYKNVNNLGSSSDTKCECPATTKATKAA